MIKAVIFDMYETLVTLYNCPTYFGAQMAEDLNINPDKFLTKWRAMEEKRTIGEVTLEEVLTSIMKENHSFDEKRLDQVVEKRIATQKECYLRLHPEIMEMLSSLKEKRMKIGLISNCFSEEAKLIRESELFPFFDAVCLSYEQGMQKPEKEIYNHCIQQLAVSPEECIYVGDGGSFELETAKKIGMKPFQAAWYLKEGTLQPAKRKPEFEQLESPMELVSMIHIIQNIKTK